MDQNLLCKYITGEATLAEKEIVIEWVKANPENLKELKAAHKLYDITLWQEEEKATLFPPKKSRTLLCYKIISMASIVLLLLSTSYFVFFKEIESSPIVMQTIHVPAGQRTELILADGTQVWLNAGTTFSFPNIFLSDKREVLLDGEGYFNVEKKPEQPFIVKTSSYDINVLGTKFNVLAYSQSSLFEVTLLDGCIEILSDTTNENIYTDKPYTKIYKAGNKLLKDEIKNHDYLSWKDGLISFDDEPVDKMVNKLELYYDVKIIVLNDVFKRRKYTGKFRIKDGIEHILKVFQFRDNFTYQKDDELNIITIK